jgi:uncharacterized LabA/DUF88 family protein
MEPKLAVFVDFENIERGIDEAGVGKFQVDLVLSRLREKGKVVVSRSYADWGRYTSYKFDFQEHGIDLIELPSRRKGQKNMADIKMVVDALDLAWKWDYIDTFVIVSGDSDFTPLISKLREYNRYVMGVGVRKSTSSLIADTCDEFVYYDDLVRLKQTQRERRKIEDDPNQVFSLLLETVDGLKASQDVILSSMVKQTLLRKKPDFDERALGFRTFKKLLETARDRGLIALARDERSGTYRILDSEEGGGAPPPPAPAQVRNARSERAGPASPPDGGAG